MSKRTKAKDQREKEYQRRATARRDFEIDVFMDMFGLQPTYRSLPAAVRDSLRRLPRFETEVVAGESLRGDPSSVELFEAVREAVLYGQPDRPPPLRLSLKTLYAAFHHMLGTCHKLGAAPVRSGTMEFTHPAGEAGAYTRAIVATFEMIDGLFRCLSVEHLDRPLYTRSVPGERLYWAGMSVLPKRGVVYTVERTAPPAVATVIRGHRRPTWPCHQPGKVAEPQPAVWTAEQIGLSGDRTYPVHIQSHAIRQWEQRLPAERVNTMLFQHSLADAVIVDARRGSGMLAYTDDRNRFGYFPFTLSDDGERVVLTTFLFLTMQGTPEYRLLGERLGLSRADIEYHRLDRAERFFQTDLCLDKDLAGRLGECGLGHLLEPAGDFDPLLLRGVAAELRKYLGLLTM